MNANNFNLVVAGVLSDEFKLHPTFTLLSLLGVNYFTECKLVYSLQISSILKIAFFSKWTSFDQLHLMLNKLIILTQI